MSRFRTDTCSQDVRSGQAFTVPDNHDMLKPLQHEIDFIDTRRSAPEQKTKLRTAWANLSFSSEGAALERLDFKNKAYDLNVSIDTIFPAVERKDKAFLVALGEKTPYYYTLVREEETEQHIHVAYEGSFGDGLVRKTFVVYKDICKLDLILELIPHKNSSMPVQARIFFPSPLIPTLQQQQVQALSQNADGCLEKKAFDQINFKEYRVSPMIFGSENRYFVHALIGDNEQFVQRGYYTKGLDDRTLVTILEGPEITEAKTWTLSWYIGPKDVEAIAPVDTRLEAALDYSGILAPLSKLLLKLLKFLYAYVQNYGWAIVLLTLLVKLVMLPFTFSGERRMKRDGKEMQRRMQYIQQKYKNDPERMRLEQAELVRKHGLPQLVGCLPLLLQVPMFIALNRVLANAIELYQAPFMGWIHDLSAPDPWYIIPFLIAVSMVIQAMMGEAQQRSTMIIAGLALGGFSTTFSAGLGLYLVANTVIGLLLSNISKKPKVA